MDTNQQASKVISNLQQLFQNSADVLFHEYSFVQSKIYCVKSDAMIDHQMLYSVVLPNIESLFKDNSNQAINEEMIRQLPIPEMKKISSKNDIITDVYSGNVIIYFEDLELLFSCNIAKKPNRTPEETNLEVLTKGPRDNFIEDLSTNIALIRKRLPTNSLCVEKLPVGKRSKTQVAILYIDDIVNKGILTELKKQIQQIDTDVLLSTDSLMESVNKKNWLLPVTSSTGRPDFAIQSLIRGRFVILVDNVSYATITPINFFYLLKSGEDSETPLAFSTFERFLRLIGVVVGITLPAFWLALTLFHQNQLPLQLLATVVMSNQGLPFPGVLEMVLLLLMFEMLREAGMRLPAKISGTTSIVGGLIIGDAIIRSGITSPAMVVVIAISTIASYTIASQSLVTMISIARIFFILVTSILGLFGFFICLHLLILYLANTRVFGVPYLNVTADLSWASIKKTLFRVPEYKYTQRPNMFDPQDETRKKNEGSS